MGFARENACVALTRCRNNESLAVSYLLNPPPEKPADKPTVNADNTVPTNDPVSAQAPAAAAPAAKSSGLFGKLWGSKK